MGISSQICEKFKSVHQIDMKFERQQRPATETSWVVLKTIPRWRTAAILKIVISPYLSEKSSAFDEILYTAADFELDERHVIKNETSASVKLTQTRHSHSKLLFHGAQISQGFYREGQQEVKVI